MIILANGTKALGSIITKLNVGMKQHAMKTIVGKTKVMKFTGKKRKENTTC